MYEAYLETEGIEYTEEVFQHFVHEHGKAFCPEQGQITYVDGKVKCSRNTENDVENQEEDVPFLWLNGEGEVRMGKGLDEGGRWLHRWMN